VASRRGAPERRALTPLDRPAHPAEWQPRDMGSWRRRRASLGLVVVVSVTACSHNGPKGLAAGATTMVASVTTLTLIAPATSTSPSTIDSTAPCVASNLRARDALNGVAAGSVADIIGLRNVSATPCDLRGQPSVELDDQVGRIVASSVPGSVGADRAPIVMLPPGGEADFTLTFPDGTGYTGTYCPTVTDLTITVPSGVGRIRLAFPAHPCSASPSQQIGVTTSAISLSGDP